MRRSKFFIVVKEWFHQCIVLGTNVRFGSGLDGVMEGLRKRERESPELEDGMMESEGDGPTKESVMGETLDAYFGVDDGKEGKGLSRS